MSPAAGVPLRPLAALTGLVLLLHALALRGVPEGLGWGPAAPLRPLVVRAVAPVAAAAPAALPEVAAAAVEPAPPVPVARAEPRRPVTPARAPTVARSAPAEAPASPAVTVPAPTAGTDLAWPVPARWHYEAHASRRGLALTGRAQLAWQPADGRYEAVLAVDVPGLPARTQRSEGRLGPHGLAPSRYADRSRSELATHFDADAGRIVFSSNAPQAALREGAQDRVSVLLQLAAMAGGAPARLAAGTTVTLQTAGAREAEDWTFTSEGEQDLELPSGTVRAIKLTRAPQREYDLALEAWFLPGRAYGPVRLRLTMPNGDWLDLLASGADKG